MNNLAETSRPEAATLREIANWQLAPTPNAHFQVDLPKLQRGFVWEPSKVINFWDSLLRGFPVGSLLLSEIAEQGSGAPEALPGKYWLLDGQQRATSIAMGFHDPWKQLGQFQSDIVGTRGWPLKVIPTLWLDLAPNPENDLKQFFPYLVNQSHPWGYTHAGNCLPWGTRRAALDAFKKEIGDPRYTGYPLNRVFPWGAELPVPIAFILEAVAVSPAKSDCDAWTLLVQQCDSLPASWKEWSQDLMSRGPVTSWAGIREAFQILIDYRIYLNYLRRNTAANDATTSEDNSLLFVRMNTGGVPLGGEEMIFSLFKSVFPKAKDAVETSAIGFMPPSRLFSLFVRLIAAEDDVTKLHNPVTLGSFKSRISTDSSFNEKLQLFVDEELHGLMIKVRNLLIGVFEFQLPPALATRTIDKTPEVFLALLFWLRKGGDVELGSEKHRRVLGCFTALSWFATGSATTRRDNLREWMESFSLQPFDLERFWEPKSILPLFTRKENAVPSFPNPDCLLEFLIKDIIENPEYEWENLGSSVDDHIVFSGSYEHIPLFDRITDDETVIILRRNILRENLKSFVGALSRCRNLLLFSQRKYIIHEFLDFGQWEFALQDSNCPWDWDHIYPSAKGKWSVGQKYRDWHDTIGNWRAEALSSNRGNGANHPKEKLADDQTRVDSFISDRVWAMIQDAGDDFKDVAQANEICRIILIRMTESYKKWYIELRIAELLRVSPNSIPK